MEIIIVAAVGQKQEIGRKNQLIWRIKEDLQHFKKTTTGHSILMGRKTYESIGTALKGRTNLVLSSQADYQAPGCFCFRSKKEAVLWAQAQNTQKLFIIGGRKVYESFLKEASYLYLSFIEASCHDADTFFPKIDEKNWDICFQKSFCKTAKTPPWQLKYFKQKTL